MTVITGCLPQVWIFPCFLSLSVSQSRNKSTWTTFSSHPVITVTLCYTVTLQPLLWYVNCLESELPNVRMSYCLIYLTSTQSWIKVTECHVSIYITSCTLICGLSWIRVIPHAWQWHLHSYIKPCALISLICELSCLDSELPHAWQCPGLGCGPWHWEVGESIRGYQKIINPSTLSVMMTDRDDTWHPVTRPLIGPVRSHDLNTDLWLVLSNQNTRILASD